MGCGRTAVVAAIAEPGGTAVGTVAGAAVAGETVLIAGADDVDADWLTMSLMFIAGLSSGAAA